MRKFKRLTLTLALLLMAVGGAWADETPLLTIESKDNTSFTSGSKTFDDKVTVTFSNPVYYDGEEGWWYAGGDPSLLTVAGINGYTITSCKFYTGYGYAQTGYPVEGESPSVYLYGGYVFNDASQSVTLGYEGVTKIEVYGSKSEPEITEWSLTHDADKKVWTLAKMPASNIELQVEYEPTKVTMAANDKAMGTVEVASGSKVEWTPDTWAGWTANTKEYTVGDITITSTNSAYINESTEAGDYLHSLSFFVNQWKDNSTVTFSTTGDPFSRIEFTMIEDYSDDWNPSIKPVDNWTFEGKSAVWEGEATKSLTLQSCSTFVSKITFYQGAAIPAGVTVNTDGTFTVAKTATVTLKATPAEGYKFLYWADDQTNTNPVREVTIESGMADKTYTAVFAEITYNVTFVEGTDLNEWSATPNTEVKKDTEVEIKYTGTKKVIGVKVEKKSTVDPANAYQKWDADQKKLVATEIPATAIKVENANDNVLWAGTYVVEDDVEINGKITLTDKVHLIIKDGVTLTVNGQISGATNLYIYGQSNQPGQLVVDNSDDDAIFGIKTLEVHSAKVTATSSYRDRGGLSYIGTINVYDGKVYARNTAADGGCGIGLQVDGKMNIFGGEVKAEGKGNGSYSYGIMASTLSTVTVYGGKLWAENAGKKALDNITLTKGAGFSGKIEYSSDNSTWSETVDADAKYVRAGY